MHSNSPNRRVFFKSFAFGTLALSTQAIPFVNNQKEPSVAAKDEKLFYRYPAMDDESVAAVVGAAHANFDKVKELVSRRPELANATWDWGFGDIESALGAASHMGRKDIAEYLMSYGARPDIFTFAMLGEIDVVKAMVAAVPGVQRTMGPHGFTLLNHVKSRLWYKDISTEEKTKVNEMIAYLESLDGAHEPVKSLPMSEEEKEIYLGEYRWGEGEDELFEVKINRRKVLQIGRKGTFGRGLHKIEDHVFSPGGAPSVRINFAVENGKAVSVTVHEPDPILTAKKI